MIRPVLNGVVTLKSTAQAMTASAADLGEEIDVRDVKILNVYLDIDINSSNNVRISFLGKLAADATPEYQITSLGTPSSGVSNIDSWYGEVTTDADQKIIVPIVLNKAYSVLQLQAWVGTAGVTPADIESVYLTFEMDKVGA